MNNATMYLDQTNMDKSHEKKKKKLFKHTYDPWRVSKFF
jgi:hypothetical protein